MICTPRAKSIPGFPPTNGVASTYTYFTPSVSSSLMPTSACGSGLEIVHRSSQCVKKFVILPLASFSSTCLNSNSNSCPPSVTTMSPFK